MSSGQKAWEEEEEEEEARAWKEHHDRIAQLGPSEIIKVVERMTNHLRCLEQNLSSMPRNGWHHLDELTKALRKLT